MKTWKKQSVKLIWPMLGVFILACVIGIWMQWSVHEDKKSMEDFRAWLEWWHSFASKATLVESKEALEKTAKSHPELFERLTPLERAGAYNTICLLHIWNGKLEQALEAGLNVHKEGASHNFTLGAVIYIAAISCDKDALQKIRTYRSKGGAEVTNGSLLRILDTADALADKRYDECIKIGMESLDTAQQVSICDLWQLLLVAKAYEQLNMPQQACQVFEALDAIDESLVERNQSWFVYYTHELAGIAERGGELEAALVNLRAVDNYMSYYDVDPYKTVHREIKNRIKILERQIQR